jgi:hypothetical protein
MVGHPFEGAQSADRYNPGCSFDVNAKQPTNIPIKTANVRSQRPGYEGCGVVVRGFSAIKRGGVSSMISEKGLICWLVFCYNGVVQVSFGPGHGKGR